MTTLYLCAAGNPEGVRLALEVNDTVQCWDRIVLLDDDPAKKGTNVFDVPVVGGFETLANHQTGDEAVNLVARSTTGREAARAKIESFGIPLVSLIHPSVDLRWATIGQATTIYAGCTISAMSTVGDHSVIFTQAVLGHGASLGVGAVLAPGAVVNARVRVGDRAYIGCNAAVLPDLEIGEGATVSACSAAVGDVTAGSTALGVPAEVMGGAKSVTPLACLDEDVGTTGPNPDTSVSLKKVQAIFAEVLNKPTIGSEVNFFDAGGSSKSALELQVALRDKLGVPVTIIDIFRFPSAGQLSTHLFGAPTKASVPTMEIMHRRRLLRLNRQADS